jgi:hypothetical protein
VFRYGADIASLSLPSIPCGALCFIDVLQAVLYFRAKSIIELQRAPGSKCEVLRAEGRARQFV